MNAIAEHVVALVAALVNDRSACRISAVQVVGTITSYLDQRFGGAVLSNLLEARTDGELLSTVGLTRAALLGGWREFVLRWSSGFAPSPSPSG